MRCCMYDKVNFDAVSIKEEILSWNYIIPIIFTLTSIQMLLNTHYHEYVDNARLPNKKSYDRDDNNWIMNFGSFLSCNILYKSKWKHLYYYAASAPNFSTKLYSSCYTFLNFVE